MNSTNGVCVCVVTLQIYYTKEEVKKFSPAPPPPTPQLWEMAGCGGGGGGVWTMRALSRDELSGRRLSVSNPDLIVRSAAQLQAALLHS